MFVLLDILIQKFFSNRAEPDKPIHSGRWVVNLPPIGNEQLGPFRTKEEALDYRREYIIRKLTETNTAEELPF